MNQSLYILFILVFFIGLSNCFDPKPEPVINSKNNYIVLLDLSDRTLSENQKERDIANIKAAFQSFKKGVKNQYYIKSNDVLQVLIAPQKNMGINKADYENQLRINLNALPVNKKKKVFDSFEKNFDETLNKLYDETLKNKTKPHHFSGADIWRFFYDLLPSYYIENSSNKLLLITDGYMEFEQSALKYEVGGGKYRFSNFDFLKRLRGYKGNWKEMFDKYDYGLKSTGKQYSNLQVFMTELSPTEGVHYEFDIIKAVWKKWFDEMKIKEIDFSIDQNALSKVKEDVEAFFDS